MKPTTPQQKKEFYTDIVKNWKTEGREAIAKRWDVSNMAVSIAVGRLRKRGVYLPKDNPTEFFTTDFLSELKTLSEKTYGPAPVQAKPEAHDKRSEPTILTKTCENEKCGNTFSRPGNLARSLWEKRRFCSRSCSTSSQDRFKNHMGSIEDESFKFAYCMNPGCSKPEAKFVAGSGVTGEGDMDYCSIRCREEAAA